MIQPAAKATSPENSFVVLGRLGRPHGVHGMLRIDLAGEHLRDFVGQQIMLCQGEKIAQVITAPTILRTLTLDKAEPAHGTVSRLAFAGINDRTAAEQLTRLLLVQPIALMRQRARAQHGRQNVAIGHLWYFELYGLTVIDAESGAPIGHITQIEDLGRNTLVTVTLNEGQAAAQRDVVLPLEYPYWGEADLDRQQIQLAEWRHFAEG